MAEAVSPKGSKMVDGSPLHSASGHGTQVLFGASHVDDEEVCVSDPAGKEELHSRQSYIGRSDPGTP